MCMVLMGYSKMRHISYLPSFFSYLQHSLSPLLPRPWGMSRKISSSGWPPQQVASSSSISIPRPSILTLYLYHSPSSLILPAVKTRTLAFFNLDFTRYQLCYAHMANRLGYTGCVYKGALPRTLSASKLWKARMAPRLTLTLQENDT